ncbi:MAG: N-acetylglucosamine-6-phosphate deacetylase, partial [Firmicutes bacterium]|nr:N-acetylglucosamine-6-phosphate deacetylase [Bacillota bacterium]
GKESGARILGAHLEGPYLNQAFHGALNPNHLREPDIKEAIELVDSGGDILKMVTLAPELPGGLDLVELLTTRGIIPSLGHSGATFDETVRAAQAGLSHITHIFNAMSKMHHRAPGPAGAALFSNRLSAEVIADGQHVHPAVLKMLWFLKGDHLALVSDAISAAGLPDGRYRFSGQEIKVTGGRAALPGGRLAGSTTTVLDGARNMIQLAGLTLPQVIHLASTNPARILGLEGKGRLAEGCDADLILLDSGMNPVMVMIEGKIFFRK